METARAIRIYEHGMYSILVGTDVEFVRRLALGCIGHLVEATPETMRGFVRNILEKHVKHPGSHPDILRFVVLATFCLLPKVLESWMETVNPNTGVPNETNPILLNEFISSISKDLEMFVYEIECPANVPFGRIFVSPNSSGRPAAAKKRKCQGPPRDTLFVGEKADRKLLKKSVENFPLSLHFSEAEWESIEKSSSGFVDPETIRRDNIRSLLQFMLHAKKEYILCVGVTPLGVEPDLFDTLEKHPWIVKNSTGGKEFPSFSPKYISEEFGIYGTRDVNRVATAAVAQHYKATKSLRRMRKIYEATSSMSEGDPNYQ